MSIRTLSALEHGYYTISSRYFYAFIINYDISESVSEQVMTKYRSS